MSAIEHLRNVMDRRVRQHPHPPANQQAFQTEWLPSPCALIRRLTFYMRWRVFAYIEAKGGHTNTLLI